MVVSVVLVALISVRSTPPLSKTLPEIGWNPGLDYGYNGVVNPLGSHTRSFDDRLL
jgi:hypothetical protein